MAKKKAKKKALKCKDCGKPIKGKAKKGLCKNCA